MPMMAPVLVFWAKYTTEAGRMKEHPTTKLARSPTKAVEVPLRNSFRSSLMNSHTTPATGPREKEQMSTGISLKSSS